MNRIDSGSGSDWCQLNDVITNCMDSAEELAKKGGITGVPTGFRDLDWYTSGFQGGDLVILAARPGMGKTAFAINSINNSAKQGFKAGFLSLEMVAQQVGNRFLSITSNINALKFRSGRFLPDDWEKMVSAAELLSTHGVWIDDHPRASYQDIHSKCKVLLSRHHANALWIDYLGFIDGDKDQNKVAEIQSITRALKQSAKEFNIPIVLICQLSRECEKRPNKRPILSDLRDSGAIEQDADVVLFLYREDYYKPDSKDKGVVEVSISKQRNGPTGTIKLQWQEEYTSFHNLAKEGTYYAQ
jgi:replicative DNA helicase